jgi:AcrR family transcriptional regulator
MVGGRPKKFDPELALDRAMDVFWRQGFEGTSISDLTDAMGINRPSLYATFGDKESLFRKALDRYVAVRACHLKAALAEPTAKDVVRKLWASNIAAAETEKDPKGCFLVQGALACSSENQAMQLVASKARQAAETSIRKRLEIAVEEGDLPKSVDPAHLARYVMTFTYGLAVQAAGGLSPAELESAAAIALNAFPDDKAE